MTQVLSVARRRPMLIVAGAVCLAIGLGASLRIWSGQNPESAIAASDNPTVTASSAEAEAFEDATGSVSWRLQSLSPQYLFPSTPKSARTANIAAGRLDPYAPLSQGRPVPRPQTTPAASVDTAPVPVSTLPPAVANAPTALPPIPVSTQPLAPLPPPLPTAAPQSVAAPTAAYASPIDSLELTGVVQVGDRPALIVREPSSTTSRYTYAGDYLAGGQILVKRIDVSNQEPLVILEYNGREYSRMVGSGPIASLP
ncbi:MAG: hypothetical protein ACFB0C_03700 [Leptolyngbyaceae cyanobacterium]